MRERKKERDREKDRKGTDKWRGRGGGEGGKPCCGERDRIQKSLCHRTRPPCLRLYSGNGLSGADVGCSCLIHQHHYPLAIPG